MQASNDVRIHPRSSEAPLEEAWWRHPQAEPSLRLPSVPTDDREGRPAFIAVVIFTFILLLSPQNWFPVLAPLRIAFLAAGGAGFALIWARWKQRRSPLRFTPPIIISFVLLFWAIVTLPVSVSTGGSVAVLTDQFIKALMILWVLANVATSVSRLRFLAVVLMLCTLPLAVTAVKNFLTGKFVTLGSTPVARILGYQASLAENPNDLALLLNVLLPLSIGLFLSARKFSVRIFCLIVLGVNVAGVVLTFSRAGFLGLAAIGMIYFAKLVRRPKPDRTWAFVMLLLAVLALPLLPSKYVDRIASIRDVDGDPTGSSQQRLSITVSAIRFVIEHPIIGAGIGMDILVLSHIGEPVGLHVHNAYLQIAVDLGVPGLALFLLMYYGVFRAVHAARQSLAGMPAPGDLFYLADAVEVSLIVFGISVFFLPVAYAFHFYYMGGLALGIAAATQATVNAARNIPVANHNLAAVGATSGIDRLIINQAR
jgi:O-antigen ligase